MIRYEQHYVNQSLLPIVWQIKQTDVQTIPATTEWFCNMREEINHILNDTGALLIRGLNQIATAKDFQNIITILSSQLMDYIGGTSPRDSVYGRIMTATNIPATWSIPLHQEMSYTLNPPDRIAFFCLKASEQGGDSTLGDMRSITKKIPDELCTQFNKHGLQLRRYLPSRHSQVSKPGLIKTWEDVFGCDDLEQAYAIAQEKSWRIESHFSDGLYLWQEVLPAMKQHPNHSDSIWFNQIHMFTPVGSLIWAEQDGRKEDQQQIESFRNNQDEIFDNTFLGNGQFVNDEEVRLIADLLKQHEIRVKLQPHDMLILDNTLIAHGRRPFTGTREILVALLNTKN